MQLPHLSARRAPGASFLAGRAPLVRPGPDAAAILGSIGETLYQWDIASDRLDWGPGHAAVLGPFARLDLSTGMAFGALIAAAALPEVRFLLRHASMAEMRTLAQRALESGDAAATRGLLQEFAAAKLKLR